jgi:chemotaxis protein histidine kinase CheA
MSQATSTDAPEPTDEDRDLDWLERNADELDPTEHMDTEAWERAREGRQDADVEDLSTEDLYRVELPDGDTHLSLFVTHSEDRHAAACSCDGFTYHGHCAHLFLLAMRDGLENILRTHNDRAEALLESDGVDADVVDHTDQDDDDQDDTEDEDEAEDTRTLAKVKTEGPDLPEHINKLESVNWDPFYRCLTCGATVEELDDLEHEDDCPHAEEEEDDEDEDQDDESEVTTVREQLEKEGKLVVGPNDENNNADTVASGQPPESNGQNASARSSSDIIASMADLIDELATRNQQLQQRVDDLEERVD